MKEGEKNTRKKKIEEWRGRKNTRKRENEE